MDIDDEVIAEYDVVLNLPQSLFLLQYPLRPRYRPYGDQGTLVDAVLSDESLVMNYSLDKNSTNFDRSNNEYKLDTQALCGKTINPLAKYCVGTVNNNSLCLTPLEKIFQMRPSTEYVDKVVDSRQTGEKEEIMQLDQERKSRNLRVFKKKDSKFDSKAKDKEKETAEEKKETHLAYFGSETSLTKELFCSLQTGPDQSAELLKKDYIATILPTPKPTGFCEYLKSLPLSSAVDELFKQVNVISTEEILEIFPSEKGIENWVIQKAVVISERWVCKSEIINAKLDRDLCLYLLYKSGSLVRES